MASKNSRRPNYILRDRRIWMFGQPDLNLQDSIRDFFMINIDENISGIDEHHRLNYYQNDSSFFIHLFDDLRRLQSWFRFEELCRIIKK